MDTEDTIDGGPAGDSSPESGEGQHEDLAAKISDLSSQIERLKKHSDTVLSEKKTFEQKYKELAKQLQDKAKAENLKSGNIDAIKADYETQLANLNEKLSAYEKAEKARTVRDRKSALVDAISRKTGITSTRSLMGLLAVAEDAGTLTINYHDEDFDTEALAKVALPKLQELDDAGLFSSPPGKPSPVPGLNRGTKTSAEFPADLEARIAARARKAAGLTK